MSFQTGTVSNLTDLLDVFATFLASAGWSIVGNWREPMFQSLTTAGLPPVPAITWRFARRIHASKGDMFVSLQDYYFAPNDVLYGNNIDLGGRGPALALHMGTSFPSSFAGDDTIHEVHANYDASGPSSSATFAGPGGPITNIGTGISSIMPLPSVTEQQHGIWTDGVSGMQFNDEVGSPTDPEVAPFGPPGGPTEPATYWMFADASGDNVALVTLRNRGDLSAVPITTYLYFGTLDKKDTWTGGQYFGASHGNSKVYTLNIGGSYELQQVIRFGPPGGMADGVSMHSHLRVDVDAFSGWASMDRTARAFRSFSSNTLLVPKAGDPTGGPFGIVQNGIWLGAARMRTSSIVNGAMLWPTYWVMQRDNGLFSLIGVLPKIYQAGGTRSFAPGSEWNSKNGTTYVIFDGFAIEKVP